MVKRTVTDSQRFVAIIIHQGNARPTLLVCAYFPSGNGAAKKTEFHTTLAQLHAFVDQFSSSHDIILAGDFNMDLYKQSYLKDERRTALNNSMVGAGLRQMVPQSGPTMRAHNGRDESFIDLVFASSEQRCCNASVVDKVPWNTSCHTPVRFSVWYERPPVRPKRPKEQRSLCVIEDTVNDALFHEVMDTHLELFEFNLVHPHTSAEILILLLRATRIQASEVRMSSLPSKRKVTYPPSVIDAMRKSRQVHAEWKSAGRPDSAHQLSVKRNRTSRAVRSAMRTYNAQLRETKYRLIMDCHQGDQRLFHSLIRDHKAKNTGDVAMVVDEKITRDPCTIREGWADFYEDLATPANNPEWDPDTLREATSSVQSEAVACLGMPRTTFITVDDVKVAAKDLNKGKAADLDGVRAEHLMNAGDCFFQALALVLQGMLEEGASKVMKTGKKIPIPKKAKDSTLMTNHRGITIASTLGKIYESILLTKSGVLHQSSMQFGFTRGLSPLMAAVILTETLNESKATGKDLLVATLDTQKAFDVVSHPILLRDLIGKVPTDIWMAIKDIYDGIRESVEWEGVLSRQYGVGQGVGQGRILSPTLYKIYMDGVLQALQATGKGAYIGSDFFGSPTVADDVMLLDQETGGMQTLLTTAKTGSDQKRYSIHPVKSELSSAKGIPYNLHLGSEVMPYTDSLTHLGVTRTLQRSNAEVVTERVQTASRTMYALMPTGMHGENGISPAASRKIVVAYILPRLLYGLEALVLNKTERSAIDRAYKSLLKPLLSLREATADEAVYLLIGLLPAEAELDVRILALFGGITRLEQSHPLLHLALRQATYPTNEKGWFSQVFSTARKYDIEAVVRNAILSPWPKEKWKAFIKETVTGQWSDQMKNRAMSKSSLKYMNPDITSLYTAHHLWPRGGCPSRKRVAASYRAKLLSGSYILQASTARFNQNEVNPTCPLCKSAPEDLPHFVLACPALDKSRKKLLPRIQKIAKDLGMFLPEDSARQCKYLLNSGNPEDCCACSGRRISTKQKHRCRCYTLNEMINDLCLNLHNQRSQVLSQTVKVKRA